MRLASPLGFTLTRYLALQFLMAVGAVMGGVMGLVLLVDMMVMFNEHSDRAGMSAPLLIGMSLLKMPSLAQKVLPYSTFFAAMWTLTRLTRSSELIVVRAAGVSVWQFLGPLLLVALVGGILVIGVFNPVAATFTARYAALEAKYIRGEASLLAVANTGLWLRQTQIVDGRTDRLVVHALRVNDRELDLEDVILWRQDLDGRFIERIDAASARLREPFWEIENALVTRAEGPPETLTRYRIATTITAAQIRESFTSPETISFWDLPGFIAMAEQAGFSAQRHRYYWHSVLALPALLAAMVLVAANFSLGYARQGNLLRVAVLGILTGFLVFFASDFTAALGQSGIMPVEIAAWVPTGIVSALGANMLLHSEDG